MECLRVVFLARANPVHLYRLHVAHGQLHLSCMVLSHMHEVAGVTDCMALVGAPAIPATSVGVSGEKDLWRNQNHKSRGDTGIRTSKRDHTRCDEPL